MSTEQDDLPMPSIDHDLIRQGVSLILQGIGEDPSRPGLLETPDRVARFYAEWMGQASPSTKMFEANGTYDQIVAVTGIAFSSMCEHHMLPFVGVAHVGYIPGPKGVLGLSKVARLVRHYSQRLQVQERLTDQVSLALEEASGACGVMVVMEAEHMCMTIRGVRSPGAKTITSAVRGVFCGSNSKEEFLHLLRWNAR